MGSGNDVDGSGPMICYSPGPWRNDRPPNDTWVQVMDGEHVVEAMARYGREGYRLHWRLRDESCCDHSRFSRWREIPSVNSPLLADAARGRTTVGWAHPGGHGPKREPAIIWADPSTLTIVREGGKRIIVDLQPGASRLLADKLGGASWVDVEAELPDADMIVIVYVPGESEPVWLAYMDADTEWRYVSGGHCHPTHWMDLPALPVAVPCAG